MSLPITDILNESEFALSRTFLAPALVEINVVVAALLDGDGARQLVSVLILDYALDLARAHTGKRELVSAAHTLEGVVRSVLAPGEHGYESIEMVGGVVEGVRHIENGEFAAVTVIGGGVESPFGAVVCGSGFISGLDHAGECGRSPVNAFGGESEELVGAAFMEEHRDAVALAPREGHIALICCAGVSLGRCAEGILIPAFFGGRFYVLPYAAPRRQDDGG